MVQVSIHVPELSGIRRFSKRQIPDLDIFHKHFLRLNRLYVVAKWYKNTVCGIRIPYGKYPVPDMQPFDLFSPV